MFPASGARSVCSRSTTASSAMFAVASGSSCAGAALTFALLLAAFVFAFAVACPLP